MSEQVEEDIKVKTKRRAKQAYKKENKRNNSKRTQKNAAQLCKTLSKAEKKSASPVQPYKQQKNQQKVLTNGKECRIINKLTHREHEKTKKKASKAQEKGLSEPEGFQRIPKNPRKKTESFFEKPLDKANEI